MTFDTNQAVVHGRTCYKHGCRCAVGRAANAEAHRQMLARRRTQPVPERVHGTENGYRNWGCRCDPCRAAGSEANHRYQMSVRRPHRTGAGTAANGRFWTPEDDIELLEANDLLLVAKSLGRTQNACRARLRLLIGNAPMGDRRG